MNNKDITGVNNLIFQDEGEGLLYSGQKFYPD
jgi:hypothetical protein